MQKLLDLIVIHSPYVMLTARKIHSYRESNGSSGETKGARSAVIRVMVAAGKHANFCRMKTCQGKRVVFLGISTMKTEEF
jgi:hypothetical protein